MSLMMPWRAGQEARLANQHAPHVDRRKPVHVLLRRNRVDDRLLADVPRQGKLHENPVDGRGRVQFAYPRQQFRLRRFRGQADFAREHADLAARLLLGRHVADARRVVPHEDDGESGDGPRARLQFRHARGDFRPQAPRQFLAVYDARRSHAAPLTWPPPRPA